MPGTERSGMIGGRGRGLNGIASQRSPFGLSARMVMLSNTSTRHTRIGASGEVLTVASTCRASSG